MKYSFENLSSSLYIYNIDEDQTTEQNSQKLSLKELLAKQKKELDVISAATEKLARILLRHHESMKTLHGNQRYFL